MMRINVPISILLMTLCLFGVGAGHAQEPQAESLRRLARLLAAHAPYDGAFPLRVPGLYVVRRSRPYPEMVRATVTPAVMRERPVIMNPAWKYRSTLSLLHLLRNPDWRRASRLAAPPPTRRD